MDVQQFVEALSTCSNSSLEVLDFMSSNLHGSLPESLGSLKYLESLGFIKNSFSGPLPATIGNLSHLQVLDLAFNNMMNGTIPESIGQLSELRASLFLESGVVHGKVDCKLMNPAFPMWLRNQSFLDEINFSNVGISAAIPDWFWKMSQSYYDWWFTVDLSDNQLRGRLPSTVNFSVGAYVNLYNNVLEGSLPLWQNVTELSLADNRFSGPIPLSIGEEMPNMVTLDLSRNDLIGSKPASITKLKKLVSLDLSRNHLSGTIPRLIMTSTIDFSNNNLSGQILRFMCSQLSSVSWLRLSNNCTRLFTLDLGGNKLSGSIPEWIGKNLYVLILGANRFTGSMMMMRMVPDIKGCM
ncbi:putative non-specific serine/threonine protein kinase [Rosa chinensis]|uniref:Putative non-specific serine/threonine protein kinase n=1 Tax=Rosa chinensis TaxID=74649 RepID=A0A2P6SGZ8_ROSCH|nr:putative non-specific serine/threonine protein kinase [Rosa chinensis]